MIAFALGHMLWPMQTTQAAPIDHRAVIVRAGGSTALARQIDRDPNNVKAWKRLNSIPSGHWQAIADAGVATLDELAAAAAKKQVA